MSLTFTFTGTESTLSADFFPALELDSDSTWEIGLLNFESFNSIPNVEVGNNVFHFNDGLRIVIPTGSYEVLDIADYLQMMLWKVDKKLHIELTPNINTLHAELKCNFPVDLTPDDSVGRLLGFRPVKLEADQELGTMRVTDIFKVNSILLNCNIVTGSYINGQPAHTIYQSYPSVGPGFKLIEEPSPVVYLPITKNTIDNITLQIADQDGRLVNFRGERITVRLHLRRRP